VPNLELDISALGGFSISLVDWLSNGRERMLWLTKWADYQQPNSAILFETMRRGCNENRQIIDAPGHLFEYSANYSDNYETRTKKDHEENSLMWGFLLFMIPLQLGGFLVAPNGDCIEVDDTSIAISSVDEAKITQVRTLAGRFSLKFHEQRV